VADSMTINIDPADVTIDEEGRVVIAKAELRDAIEASNSADPSIEALIEINYKCR
jgi:hypothetical protein